RPREVHPAARTILRVRLQARQVDRAPRRARVREVARARLPGRAELAVCAHRPRRQVRVAEPTRVRWTTATRVRSRPAGARAALPVVRRALAVPWETMPPVRAEQARLKRAARTMINRPAVEAAKAVARASRPRVAEAVNPKRATASQAFLQEADAAPACLVKQA